MATSHAQDPWIFRNFYPVLIFIFVVGFASIFGVLVLYSSHFKGPIDVQHQRWAEFGEFFGGTLGPFLSFLALLGTLLALGFSTYELRRKQRDDTEEDNRRRKIVFHLLKNEIEIRWRGTTGTEREGIEPKLKQLVAMRDKPIEAAETFVNKAKIGPDDMIVFKLIGTSFPDYYFLEDPDLVSQIIHGHVLMRDLADFHELTKSYLKDKKQYDIELKGFPDRLDKVLQKLEKCHNLVLDKLTASANIPKGSTS